MRLIAKATASNTATIDWALPQGFSRFRIIGDAFLPATDGTTDQSNCILRVSTDGGSNYAATSYANASMYAFASGNYRSVATTTGLLLAWGYPGNQAGEGNTFDATLMGHKTSELCRVISLAGGKNVTPNITVIRTIGQYDGSTDRVTHVRLLAASGNITSGTFHLYGES